ncbi:MAG TPA: GspE/PulE family protein [Candidatus Gracilibacteria bacterium]|nr:GspE/PulE family protein [Candidatus Gracilibacteria bacterium]
MTDESSQAGNPQSNSQGDEKVELDFIADPSKKKSAAKAKSLANENENEVTEDELKEKKEEERTLALQGINRDFEEKDTLKKAEALNLSYVNIGKTPLNPDYMKLIPFEDSKKGKIVSFFKFGNKLRVAVVNPDDEETKKVLESLRGQGYQLNVNLASQSGILEVIEKYNSLLVYKEKSIVEKVEEAKIKTYEKEIAELKILGEKIAGVTAEEGVNMINIGAMKTKASDVHYEPEENQVRVRFRIDGVLYKVFDLKPSVYKNILNQVKYQTRMKLNVSDIPQDGRYSFNYNDRKIDVRVSVIPTENSESIVCRFLDSGKKFTSFEDLGYEGVHLDKLNQLLGISHGMILITGPTGSGKTTSLYSMLQGMNTPDKKIITLENPIEYHIDGIVQSQVSEAHNYDFASGLKSILRQDPDIVMIGEIRDLETANTAAQAALTGHVVLATLHTNSALESIPRLINMGMEPFFVAPALDTLIAQRLVRRVCKKCGKLEPITPEEKQKFEEAFEDLKKTNPTLVPQTPEQVYHAVGCDECSNTGYLGRLVIAEMCTVTDEIEELILNRAPMHKIMESARKQGFMTMQEDGYKKIALGLTTVDEVYRTVKVSEA